MTVNNIKATVSVVDVQPHSTTEKTRVNSNSSDASWFSAAIQPTQKHDSEANVAERIVGQLSGSSEHLQKLSDKADRALQKASKSSDPQDVVKASRSLSSFYLESLLTTKLISKGTQTVEKLTSLQ